MLEYPVYHLKKKVFGGKTGELFRAVSKASFFFVNYSDWLFQNSPIISSSDWHQSHADTYIASVNLCTAMLMLCDVMLMSHAKVIVTKS